MSTIELSLHTTLPMWHDVTTATEPAPCSCYETYGVRAISVSKLSPRFAAASRCGNINKVCLTRGNCSRRRQGKPVNNCVILFLP